jgi:hypothetical protein
MNVQKLFTVLTPYSLLISLLYLFGFWSSFDINVLEYIAFSDVLKSAMYPLMYSSVFLLIGFSVGNLIATPLETVLPPGAGKDVPEAKYFRWLFRISWCVLLVIIAYVILFQAGNYRWYKVAFLLVIVMSYFVGDASFAESYIPIKRVRVVLVNVFTAVAVYSFGWGAVDANNLKHNDAELKLNGTISEYKYIGWAGDFLFLWDDSGKKVIAKSKSTIKSIERSVDRPKPIIDLGYGDK